MQELLVDGPLKLGIPFVLVVYATTSHQLIADIGRHIEYQYKIRREMMELVEFESIQPFLEPIAILPVGDLDALIRMIGERATIENDDRAAAE